MHWIWFFQVSDYSQTSAFALTWTGSARRLASCWIQLWFRRSDCLFFFCFEKLFLWNIKGHFYGLHHVTTDQSWCLEICWLKASWTGSVTGKPTTRFMNVWPELFPVIKSAPSSESKPPDLYRPWPSKGPGRVWMFPNRWRSFPRRWNRLLTRFCVNDLWPLVDEHWHDTIPSVMV